LCYYVFVCILARKVVPKMTYTVSGATLNPTRLLTHFLLQDMQHVQVYCCVNSQLCTCCIKTAFLITCVLFNLTTFLQLILVAWSLVGSLLNSCKMSCFDNYIWDSLKQGSQTRGMWPAKALFAARDTLSEIQKNWDK